MRRLRTILLLTLAVAAVTAGAGCTVYAPAPGGPPSPRVSTQVSFFYDHLAPYGDWVWMEVHGWVWAPRNVPVGWRPYTHGRWVYTAHGWTWASDWRWGWATFHYGRWTWHPDYGWVWIPGTEWAPAWVAWRHGPGWVGWAPLPPGVHWEVGFGFDLGDVTIHLGWWNFVPSEHFAEHKLYRRVIPGDSDPDLARITREVTRYERDERGVIERGLPVEEIERETRHAVPRLEIEDLEQPPRLRAEPVDGDRLRVYRPQPSGGSRPESGRTATREESREDSGKADGRDRGASRTRPPKPGNGR